MSDNQNNLRTPIAEARGLGSAKSGTAHWWAQKVTSIALLPLTLWFVVVTVSSFVGQDFNSIYTWMEQPLNGGLMIALLGVMFYHLALGIQVILEDYVHGFVGIASLVILKLFSWAVGGFAVLAVIKIVIGGH